MGIRGLSKSINKNIIALGFVSFFTDMASAMVTPLIPILVVYVLHEDVQTLSKIIAITTFASYGFRFVFGYLGDKYQKTKLFVVLGYVISAITKPLFYFAQSWQSVTVIQTTERMGKAIRSASKDRLISVFATEKQSGKAFGFHKMMDIAGELVGAIIVFSLLSWLGQSESIIRSVFALTIIPGVIAVVIVIFSVDDAPVSHSARHYQWDPKDTQLLPVLFFYFLFLLFIFSASFLVIRVSELGYSIALIPVFFIVLNLTQTLSSYHLGLRIDRWGARTILLLSFVFGVLAQVCLYFDWVWAAFVFLGLFTVGSLNAIRSDISDRAVNQSTMYGIFYAGIAIFSALGALIVGFIWSHWGVIQAILVSVAGTVSLTLVFVLSGLSGKLSCR